MWERISWVSTTTARVEKKVVLQRACAIQSSFVEYFTARVVYEIIVHAIGRNPGALGKLTSSER